MCVGGRVTCDDSIYNKSREVELKEKIQRFTHVTRGILLQNTLKTINIGIMIKVGECLMNFSAKKGVFSS